MQSFWNWLIDEAGAAWIIGSLGLVLSLYSFYLQRTQKPRKGRHVVCTQSRPQSSHLYLSERAKEWVKVEYIGQDRGDPLRIDTLSQVTIEIKNESETDALNDVELRFWVPDTRARVLRVWWEKAPEYLVEQSEPSFHFVERPSDRREGLSGSYWEIRVSLAQLKSYEKYKEDLEVGVLAEGDLTSIGMLAQGSTGGPLNQIWTAKFVSFAEYEAEQKRDRLRRSALIALLLPSLLLMITAVFLRISFKLWGPFRTDWRLLVASSLFGSALAGLVGYSLQRLRLRRVQMCGVPRMWA